MLPSEQNRHFPAMKMDDLPLPTILFSAFYVLLLLKKKQTSIPDDLLICGMVVLLSVSITLTLKPLQSPKLEVLNGKFFSLFCRKKFVSKIRKKN